MPMTFYPIDSGAATNEPADRPRPANLPADFVPERYPIISRHWFGVEPIAKALPDVIEAPIATFVPRRMYEGELGLVVGLYWRLRREGLQLPAERGVILLDGDAT